MSLKLKVRIAQVGIFCRKVAELARRSYREAQKLALAVVIVEFILAGGFYWIVKENLIIPQIVQIAPVEAKTAQHNEAQAPQKEEAKPSTDDNEDIKQLIWTRESTAGKNNYSKCEARGMINGIGYAIGGSGKYICFRNHAEEMQVLDSWIEKNKDIGRVAMLCKYSGGNYPECK